MKKLLFISLLLAVFHSYGQSVVPLRGDTIKISKVGGNGELVIKNRTRDTAGLGYNAGGGLLEFGTPIRINDSTITIGPITIITQGPGSPPGTPSGDTIYIAAAVDTVYLFNIGNLAPAQRTIYAVDGNLRASNWGNGLFTFIRMAPDSSLYEDIDTAGLRAYLEIAAGGIIVTADNGLQRTTLTNIQIGGVLLHNSEIATGPYQLEISSDQGPPLVVMAANANNANQIPVAILKRRGGTAPAGFYGESIDFDMLNSTLDSISASSITTFWNTSTAGSEDAIVRISGVTQGFTNQPFFDFQQVAAVSYGTLYGLISTQSQFGLLMQTSYSAAEFDAPGPFVVTIGVQNPSNDVETGLLFARGGTGAGIAGLGSAITFRSNNSANSEADAGRIINDWVSATAGNQSSEYIFEVMNNGTPLQAFIIRNNGTYNTPDLPVFANNAAALAGTLVAGDHYRTSTGAEMVAF